MVGGATRKDDGMAAISSSNIFAALEKKRRKSSKKKLSDKDSASSKGKDSKGDKKEDEPEQFWAPSQVTVKSWADCDDDEDYYATTAPPPAPEVADQQISEAALGNKDGGVSQGEETEGDDDGEEEVEDEDEAQENENESLSAVSPDAQKTGPQPLFVSREPERQLSKRELKKKELAELDAVLLELGMTPREENGTPLPVLDEKSPADDGLDQPEESEMRSGPALTESKSTKRRKAKREKSFKEGRDGDVPPTLDADSVRNPDEGIVDEESDGRPADPKEVLRKLASMKKKKSIKETDSAAKAAASEAAARAAKLAAAKKKEKNHYNQQPVR